jgi:CxxC motif-containing protein
MEIICIACPNGCHLTAEQTAQGLVIRGNTCPKGEEYGQQEATDPRRIVTAAVKTSSPDWPCVPVKSAQAVPKRLIPALLKTLYAMRVHLPVRRGTVLIENFEQTGISVVVTRSMPPPSMSKTGAEGEI